MSDKPTASKGKRIVVEMGDQELTFDVTLQAYNDYLNKVTMKNKIQPAHNFLMNCAADDDTKKAVKYCYQQALTVELLDVVQDEYKPKVEFAVKQ